MWSELFNGQKDGFYYENCPHSKIVRVYAEYSKGKLHSVYKTWSCTDKGILIDEIYYVNGKISNS